MCFSVYFVYAMMELFTFQATHRAPASPLCVYGFKNDQKLSCYKQCRHIANKFTL